MCVLNHVLWSNCVDGDVLVKDSSVGQCTQAMRDKTRRKKGKMLFQTLLLYLQTHNVRSFWSDPPRASRWMSSLTTECHLRGFFFFIIVFHLNRNNRGSCTVAVLANVGSTWQSAIVFLCHYNHSECSETCHASHNKDIETNLLTFSLLEERKLLSFNFLHWLRRDRIEKKTKTKKKRHEHRKLVKAPQWRGCQNKTLLEKNLTVFKRHGCVRLVDVSFTLSAVELSLNHRLVPPLG